MLKKEYLIMFEELLPGIVKESFPDVFYWPSSPSSGGGFDESNGQNRGNGHHWGIWFGNQQVKEYRKSFCRFVSEFGSESLPDIRTLESFSLPEDRNLFSYIMELHQKNPGGNEKIMQYVGQSFQYPKDFKALAYTSQLMQAEAMRIGVEHWRRNRGRCMGSLYWQINDCYPALSWSGIDYYGRWKALHYAAKRFYSPILLSAMEDGTNVELHVTNETMQEFCGKIRWQLLTQEGSELFSGQIAVCVNSLTNLKLIEQDFGAHISKEQIRETYLRIELFDEAGLLHSKCTVAFVAPKYMQLKRPKFRTRSFYQDGRSFIELSSHVLAKFVELRFTDRDAIFSDNYFDLNPGEIVIIEVIEGGFDEMGEQISSLEINSLYHSYMNNEDES